METLPDTFVHPAGYCQNVLATGRTWISGTDIVAGREAIVVECDHPRAIEMAADRPDFHIQIVVDRADGVILRLTETIGGDVTRQAEVVTFEPNAAIPASRSTTRSRPATRPSTRRRPVGRDDPQLVETRPARVAARCANLPLRRARWLAYSPRTRVRFREGASSRHRGARGARAPSALNLGVEGGGGEGTTVCIDG